MTLRGRRCRVVLFNVGLLGAFPFGEPVATLRQHDRSPKEIFVLGVYASAVHARWVGPAGKELVRALAVRAEPYIFWRGDGDEALVSGINLPPQLGRLEPAASMFNGPSGRALDERILGPLNRGRDVAWLSDLVPHSCMNPSQERAIARAYLPLVEAHRLPPPCVPCVPRTLATLQRQQEVADELLESEASTLVLLGDEPIRWFSSRWLPQKRRLSDFGESPDTYGRLHPVEIHGRRVDLLPVAHPRQVAKLGRSSEKWYHLHEHWATEVAPFLLG